MGLGDNSSELAEFMNWVLKSKAKRFYQIHRVDPPEDILKMFQDLVVQKSEDHMIVLSSKSLSKSVFFDERDLMEDFKRDKLKTQE